MPELLHEPSWSAGSRGRVLIEATEWSQRQSIAAMLEGAGFSAVACPGPEGTDERCSLASGHGCVAAEQADVVVHTLRRADARNREVLLAIRKRLSRTPVVVEAPLPVLEQHPEDYEGCITVPAPLTRETLVAAVERAISG